MKKRTLRQRYEESVERLAQKVDFDFRQFLKDVGPTRSADEPLGPTSDCLSLEQIRSIKEQEVGTEEKRKMYLHLFGCVVCRGLLQHYNVPFF